MQVYYIIISQGSVNMNSISSQFNSFFIDVKNFFINIWNTIHNFLNNYMDDTTLGIFAIAIVAILIVIGFKKISN